MAKSYGIRAAKAHFSELVGDARAGRETVITARGKPVAKLVSIGSGSIEKSIDEAWAQAAAEGWVEPPSRRKRKLPPPIEPKRPVDLGALVRTMRR